jgi:hypothetical protein
MGAAIEHLRKSGELVSHPFHTSCSNSSSRPRMKLHFAFDSTSWHPKSIRAGLRNRCHQPPGAGILHTMLQLHSLGFSSFYHAKLATQTVEPRRMQILACMHPPALILQPRP